MRHALITGGTQGIGCRVAEDFLKNGWTVTLNYRSNHDRARQFVDENIHYQDKIQLVDADITNKLAVSHLSDATINQWGRIDALINCAGPFVFQRKSIVDHEGEEWEQMIKGNLSSVFYLLKKVIPVMRQQRFGRIITFGFQNADDATGWMDHGPFAAAKVGLVSLMKTLAIEEAGHGITANMICPGIILPEMKTATIDEAQNQKRQRTPFGRSVTGEDISRTIAFLCEENSQMINGSVLDITGSVNVIHRFRPTFD